jgi:hypothetical protein
MGLLAAGDVARSLCADVGNYLAEIAGRLLFLARLLP